MGRPVIHDRYCNSHFASLGLCEKELGRVSGQKVINKRTYPYAWKTVRGRKMKTRWMMVLVLSGFLGIAQQGWAAKAYVTDSFEITLRTGPSNENKIIAMLFSGRPLEVLDTRGDWSQVKVLDDGKEGWVLTRYLVTRPSWEVQAKKLQEDSASLNAKVNRLQKELADESQQRQVVAAELKQKTQELEALSKEYLELKKGAEGYLRLKTIHEASEKDLKAIQGELNKITAENEDLRASERNRWFLSGALVLLCGLLIGGIAGRQQKKRRSLYS
jgi:SH3 domain protein